MTEELSYEEKKDLILSIIYSHYQMDITKYHEDEEIAELILKICGVKEDD